MGQGLEAAIRAVTVEGLGAGAVWGGAAGADVGDDATWQENPRERRVNRHISLVLGQHSAHLSPASQNTVGYSEVNHVKHLILESPEEPQ